MKTTIKTSQALLYAAGMSILLMLTPTNHTQAQNVGISANGILPHNSAMLDVDVSALPANNKKGMLIPRVALTSNTDVTTIPSPTTSLVVYNTNASMTNGNGEGFYYWDASAGKWMYMATAQNGPGSAGQVLTSTGPGSQPQWSTLSVSGGGGNTGCSNCVTMISPLSSGPMQWGQCAAYCRGGTWGGYTDWRVPTFEEAIDYTIKKVNTSLSGSTFPATNYIWTSTPAYYSLTGSTTTIGYWIVFLESAGYWNLNSSNFSSEYCRCVR